MFAYIFLPSHNSYFALTAVHVHFVTFSLNFEVGLCRIFSEDFRPQITFRRRRPHLMVEGLASAAD